LNSRSGETFETFSKSVDNTPPKMGESAKYVTPIGVLAETISSSSIHLSWIDPNNDAFDQYYTMRYSSKFGSFSYIVMIRRF